MLSHLRRERFLVITLPAVENQRSGAAEDAGKASTRLAMTPNQGKRCTAHLSRGFSCPWERGRCESLMSWSPSLSAISALERSREFTASAVEGVTKKSLTSSIELLMSADASVFLNSSITAMTIPHRSAHVWSCWLEDGPGRFWLLGHVTCLGKRCAPRRSFCMLVNLQQWVTSCRGLWDAGSSARCLGIRYLRKEKRNWNQNHRSLFKMLILKTIHWCCFYYPRAIKKSLVAMLELSLPESFFTFEISVYWHRFIYFLC